LVSLIETLGEKLSARHQRLSVAESCTGGFLSNWITDSPGASRYFEQGVVVYSNPSKQELLGVSAKSLEQFGAVSAEVATEMAQGLRLRAKTDYALAITGIAGPGGGMPDKPVGTVFIACADGTACQTEEFHFPTDRIDFKRKAAEAAVRMLLKKL